MGPDNWKRKRKPTLTTFGEYFSEHSRKTDTLGGGNGNPLQYSCLESPMDRGVWQATVHGVAKSHTTERLSMHACTRMNQEAFSCKKWKRMAIDFQTIDYQSAIPEPITSASPGNLLEMQILGSYQDPIHQTLWERDPAICCFGN